MERCEYCDKWFESSFMQEVTPRKHWFCCDSHRTMFFQGRRLCLCCEKSSRGANQCVCEWCHVNVYGGKSKRGRTL